MRKTLVEWAKLWPFNIDAARKVVRERPELQQLGERFGAVRVFNEGEAEQIRRALEERASARRPVAESAA